MFLIRSGLNEQNVPIKIWSETVRRFLNKVEEENLQSSSICDKNLELHGKRIDPYAEKLSIQEKDKNTINSLKRKADQQLHIGSPAKSQKTSSGRKTVTSMCGNLASKDEDETAYQKAKERSEKSEVNQSDLPKCEYSGIRLRSYEKGINAESVRFKLGINNSKFTHLHILANGSVPKVEFATIGILVKKVTPSTVDKKGNKFTIMSFSNLRDDQKVIKIMAFGDIHKSHWKTQLGKGIH